MTIGFNILTQWKDVPDMVYTCELCEDNYESLIGLLINNIITTSLTYGYENVSVTQIDNADVLITDEIFIEQIPKVVPNLPSYPDSSNPYFSYHDIPEERFPNLINDLFNEIVTWKKNLFKLLTGNAAKAFIK